MFQPIVLLFIPVALLFSLVHNLAVRASLYWHYWWFDILMHFWGGLLIAMGVVTLTSFRRVALRPTLTVLLLVTTFTVLAWELFEWQVEIMNPRVDWVDTLLDILLGYSGAIIGYWLLKQFGK